MAYINGKNVLKCVYGGAAIPIDKAIIQYSNDGTDGLSYAGLSGGTMSCVGIGSAAELDILIASKFKGRTVTTIGESAFVNCRMLKSVIIQDTVKSIGVGAFSKCYMLERVGMPKNLTTIGDAAFYRCDSLTFLSIPIRVNSIGSSAFYGCSNLTTIKYGGTCTMFLSKFGDKWYEKETWANTSDALVIECTDGTIDKNGNVTTLS